MIEVTVKNVYGVELIYPTNPAGQTFCELLGKKTMTVADISRGAKLGLTFRCCPVMPSVLVDQLNKALGVRGAA